MSGIDWTSYLRAPNFDVAGGVGLAHGLLAALPKGMPPAVKAAAKKMRHDVDALKNAWRPALFKAKAEKTDLRALDTKYDATWRAIRDRLVAVEALDDAADDKADAKLLHDRLFGAGTDFLAGQGKTQWAACEARIDGLEKADLVGALERVVGAAYWRQLKRQHAEYGVATGATKALPVEDPSAPLLEPLRDLQRSMTDYLIQVVAAAKHDAALEPTARAALTPVDAHRASAARANKPHEPATKTPQAPAPGPTPVTPDTPTPELPTE